MSQRHLVDTDWVIHYLNGHPEIVARLRAYRSAGLAISIVSVAELYEGVYNSHDPEAEERAIQQFLRAVLTLDIDEATAKRFGKERARLRTRGQLIGDLDLLIGATALVHGLTLLTNNRKHFERLDGITLESQ